MNFRRQRMPGPGRRMTIAGYGWALLLFVAVFMPWGQGVLAQGAEEVKVILERMGRLERDIRTLNLSLARGAPRPASAPAAPPAAGPAPQAGTAAPGPAPAVGGGHAMIRLCARLSELENDLRAATGSMERFGFQLGQISSRFDKLIADVDYRLGVLEGRPPGAPGALGAQGAQARPAGPPRIRPAPAPPSVRKIIPGGQGGAQTSGAQAARAQAEGFASPPGILGTVSQPAAATRPSPANKDAKIKAAAKPPAKPAPAAPVAANVPSVLPQGTPKEQYNYAFGLLRQANYDKAELALQEFVKLHPKEDLVGNARYWLGETFYVRAAYVQAAEAFLEGYQADPKGPKAPDSLLKLGMSLAGLDKKREACASFDKLTKDFPKISAGIRNTVKREKQKNSCK